MKWVSNDYVLYLYEGEVLVDSLTWDYEAMQYKDSRGELRGTHLAIAKAQCELRRADERLADFENEMKRE